MTETEKQELLAKFSTKADFANTLQKWTAEERDRFCNFAMLIHNAGLDWWNVEIPKQVRFGRKGDTPDETNYTLG